MLSVAVWHRAPELMKMHSSMEKELMTFYKSRRASIFSVRGPSPLLPLSAGMRVRERYLYDFKQLVCSTRVVNQTYRSALSHTDKSSVMQHQRMQVMRWYCAFVEKHMSKKKKKKSSSSISILSSPHYKADISKMALIINVVFILNIFLTIVDTQKCFSDSLRSSKGSFADITSSFLSLISL